MSSLRAKIEEQVRPVKDAEHLAWGFMAPDFDILFQFIDQPGNQPAMSEQTGIGIRYDSDGLAQAPMQVNMGEF